MPISSHQQLLLDEGEQPCTSEWCPDTSAASVLAVGTYQLDEASQQRRGRLLMYGLAPAAGGSGGAAPPPQLVPLSSLALPGIFDLRWHPRSAMPQLAAATADGSLRLLAFGGGLAGGGAAAQPAATTVPSGDEAAEGMAVSVDYSKAAGCEGDQLVASFSSGQLQLWQVRPCSVRLLSCTFAPCLLPHAPLHLLASGASFKGSCLSSLPPAPTTGRPCRPVQPGHVAGAPAGGVGRRL